MSVTVILQQILIIFLYVAIGWLLSARGILTGKDAPVLSRLLISVTLPLNILSATSIEATSAELWNMLAAGLLYAGMILLATAVAAVMAERRHFSQDKKAVFCGLCAYPNVGFMGVPLCTALMGAWGGLYGAATVSAFNLAFYTVQVLLFRPDEKLRLKTFLNPLNLCTAAAIFMLAAGWHLPMIAQTVCTNVGNITTPLALILVGILMGGCRLREIFRGKLVYAATILRNLLWPLAMLGLLFLLPLDRTMKLALMVFTAMPCANLTAIYATQYDMEAQLCSRAILLSTLCSIVSLPLLLVLAQAIL